MKNIALLLFSFLSLNASAVRKPAHIFIIRHAEELSGTAWTLSPEGVSRANALGDYFSKLTLEIGGIFAPIPDEKSGRSFETCEPLARSLNQKVQLLYRRNDTVGFAEELRKNIEQGKSVVVCWTHRNIPDIVKALGVNSTPVWDSNVFDEVWDITFQLMPNLSIYKQEFDEKVEV